MEKTIVIFRKFKHGGHIIALFPAELADYNGNCSSYQHVGQHGPADYTHCIATSVPAKPTEYRALRQELENIGYKLDVKNATKGNE